MPFKQIRKAIQLYDFASYVSLREKLPNVLNDKVLATQQAIP